MSRPTPRLLGKRQSFIVCNYSLDNLFVYSEGRPQLRKQVGTGFSCTDSLYMFLVARNLLLLLMGLSIIFLGPMKDRG